MRSAIAIVVLLYSAIGLMAEEFLLPSGIKVSIEPDNKDLSALRDYLRLADRVSSRLLLAKTNDRCSQDAVIIVATHAMSNNFELETVKKRTIIYLPGEARKWQNDYQAQKRLMATLLLLKCGLPPTALADLDSLPPWLLTGAIEYLSVKNGRDIAIARNYFELRTLDHYGAGISLDDIITGTYAPEDGVFFDLFSQGSESLLSLCLSLATTKDNIIKEMVEMSFRRTKPAPEIFSATAGARMLKKVDSQTLHDKTLSNQEKIRNWFRTLMQTRNVNFFYPRDSQEIAERFKSMLVIQVKIIDGKGKEATVNCKLENLAAEWPHLVNPIRVMNDTRQELLKLQNEAPGELLPPMWRIYQALNKWYELQPESQDAEPKNNQQQKVPQENFQMTPEQQESIRKQTEQKKAKEKEKSEITPEKLAEKAEEFHKDVIAGIEEFNRITREYEQIEKYLQDLEKVHVPAEMRFYYRLKSLDDMDILSRKIWPDANKYLDGLEKEYFKD